MPNQLLPAAGTGSHVGTDPRIVQTGQLNSGQYICPRTTVLSNWSLKNEIDRQYSRDEDPDPVGSVDFWPAGSGSGTFFNGSGSYL